MARYDNNKSRGGRDRNERGRNDRGRSDSRRDDRNRDGRGRSDGRRDDRTSNKRGFDDRSRGAVTSSHDGDLPKWIREEINRTAPKDRREPAIAHLAKGVKEFADERYGAAYEQFRQAKDLAPQAATVRELLGLSAYHTERWKEALRELRTFRRISGEATQVPVEMDCLRALGKPEDIEKTWKLFQTLEKRSDIDDEGRVVYASALLDAGLIAEAWRAIKPGRLIEDPRPAQVRRWYVAARVALAADDRPAASTLLDAVERAVPDFPGVPELRSQIDG